MTHEAQLPIALAEAADAFARTAPFDHAILAVSGGPDSMALLVLAAECFARKGEGAPQLSVATIDHGLRPESGAEAAFVASEARRLGLPHTTLRWTGEKPATGIAAAARSARYRLLEEHARSFPAERVAVVTAHHLDDQAETFAMRLARGAGVAGLAAMAAERPLTEGSPIRLIRPLLTFPKSRLIATLEARNVRFFNDPTNTDERYERARVRRLLPALNAAGITSAALATSARRLGEAEAALRYAEDRFIATLDLSFGNEVFASLKTDAFREGPSLLRQRVLAHLITRYGGESQKPQLSEIEDLAARLQSEGKCMATLGGAMISSGGRFIRVWREAGRLTQAEFELSPGESPDLGQPLYRWLHAGCAGSGADKTFGRRRLFEDRRPSRSRPSAAGQGCARSAVVLARPRSDRCTVTCAVRVGVGTARRRIRLQPQDFGAFCL